MSAKVEVAKTYRSKCGNTVKVLAVRSEDDAEGQTVEVFTGHVTKVIKGHEAWLNHTMEFDGAGHWFDQDKKVVTRCIHDLKEEVAGG